MPNEHKRPHPGDALAFRLRALLPHTAADELFTPAWQDIQAERLVRPSGPATGVAPRLRDAPALVALWLDCWRLVLANPGEYLGRPLMPADPRPQERQLMLLSDLRFAARTLLREPLFAGFVVVTLALGIGANAAIFGVVDRLLVRGPEHVVHPEQVQRVYLRPPGASRGYASFGYVTYDLLRRTTSTFSGVSAYAINTGTFGEGGSAEQWEVGAATADLFPVLGVHAALGRFFSAQEDNVVTPERVVVLGDGVWRREFGRDPRVLGRTIRINGDPFTIVGVAPPGFTGPELGQVDAWVPMSVASQAVVPDWPTAWNAQWLKVIGRLKPGVTVQQASADASAALRHGYTGNDPDLSGGKLFMAPLLADNSGREPTEVTVLRWLVGVAAIVLLIACSNVTNLMLARAARRRREIAVRLALGAARRRLLSLLLTESGLLAVMGGAAGLLVAWVSGRLMRTILLPNIEWTTSPVSGRVLVISAVVTVLVALVVGMVPAIRGSRPELTASLKAGTRQAGVPHSRLRAFLTVSQATLSVVLLVGAGLFVRSLWNVQSLDLGIEPSRVGVVELQWPPLRNLPPDQRADGRRRRAATYAALLERARHLPGIEHAGLAVGLPFASSFSQYLRVDGRDTIPALPGDGPYLSAVTDDYFETVGTKLIRGREFTSADRAGSEPVTIVDQTMATTLWPNRDPIGQCLYTSPSSDSLTVCTRVVGIAANAHRFRLREAAAMHYYLPLGQEDGFGGTVLLVRPAGGLAMITPGIRTLVAGLDPSVTYASISLLQRAIDPQIRPWRLGALLFGFMGVLALLVAAVGLYSVVSYLMTQRTHEIGVRIALGAGTSSILGLVLRNGLGLASAGVVLGLGVALVAGRALAPVLFETSPHDPIVLAGVSMLMIAVAVAASLIPANRARRVDPIEALRYD